MAATFPVAVPAADRRRLDGNGQEPTATRPRPPTVRRPHSRHRAGRTAVTDDHLAPAVQSACSRALRALRTALPRPLPARAPRPAPGAVAFPLPPPAPPPRPEPDAWAAPLPPPALLPVHAVRDGAGAARRHARAAGRPWNRSGRLPRLGRHAS